MAGFHELMPNLVKKRISQTRPLVIISHPEREPIEVTFAVLDNAVNRAAWFITENLPEDEETFIWMSQSDARYVIWALAAMKTGKVVVFPSLSNRVSANLRLFDTVGAKHMFYGPESAGTLGELINQASATVAARPGLSLQDLVSAEPVKEYPFDKEYDDIKNKRFMALHTSGTSGHPKPIWWTHAHFECLFSSMEDGILPEGTKVENHACSTLDGHDVLVIGSQSHAGTLLVTMIALRADVTVIIMHPDLPIIPANITAVLQQTGANSMICPPVPIENMLNYPPGVEALSRLKHVGYVGGPINPVLGAQLAKFTPHLYSLIGSTEGGIIPLDLGAFNSEHWDALHFVDIGQRMDEVFPGLYELVFPRTDLIDRCCAYFRSYPDLEGEYRTKDLFAPVPGQPGWWRFRGRTDNWVAMSNGLKMDPTDFEARVASDPRVRGVIVGGSHRFRLCLLVEMHDPFAPSTPAEAHDALETLWPTIRDANAAAPKFGQIPRELVLFAARHKPFMRAGKGTIQRQLTLQAYEDELDALYARVESGVSVSDLEPLASLAPEGLAPLLTQLYQQALDAADVDADTDVFARGLDSNGVTITISRLKAALRQFGVSEDKLRIINIGFMYSATTARELAGTLSAVLLSNGEEKAKGEGRDRDDGGVAELLHKYIPLATRAHAPHSVVLTGTTGSLGTYLLSALQALPTTRVRRIFCLNRAPDARAKQAAALKSRGLPPAQDSISPSSASPDEAGRDKLDDETAPRVVFLTVPDFGAPRLGLSAAEYEWLAGSATAIIHNAWPVNFLLPLRSFEPSVRGVAHILELARAGRRRPGAYFVSSIAAAMTTSRRGAAVVVPEEVLQDARTLVLRQGYARSKFVGEALVDAYAKATGRRAAVLRVGQVAGPVGEGDRGAWNRWEWFPSLVRSAKALGCLPRTLGSSSRVEWVPVDELSRIIVEVVLDYDSSPSPSPSSSSPLAEPPRPTVGKGARVFNLVNPTPVPWTELLPALLEKGVAREVVSLEEWIEALEQSSRDTSGGRKLPLEENPAVKLLDFYRSLVPPSRDTAPKEEGVSDESTASPRNGHTTEGGEDDYTWCVDNTLRASPTARALRPVNTEWMKLWVDRWRF
ncbi:hypothetical protein AAE478_004932 [Parahypoxylon ruwenzoriense]